MTEFKKVSELVMQMGGLYSDVKRAVEAPVEEALPIEQWDTWRRLLMDGTVDMIKRAGKLYAKAVETDPNKQIYNEQMCAKIANLFQTAVDSATRGVALDSDAPAWDTLCGSDEDVCRAAIEQHSMTWNRCNVEYERAALELAASAAFREEAERSIAALLKHEPVLRAGKYREQAVEWGTLLTEAAAARKWVRDIEEEREAQLWIAEQKRRAADIQRAKTVVDASNREGITNVVERVFVPLLNSHPVPAQRVLSHLARLLREILAHPERREIRHLNCHSRSFISDFGHAAVTGSEGCCCSKLVDAAEEVLFLAGFVPTYTAAAKSSNSSLSLIDVFASGAAVALPCDHIGPHRYLPVGYERYGERYLLLKEPDPSTSLEEWCAWHESLKALVSVAGRLVGRLEGPM